jgi:hypothetical protein
MVIPHASTYHHNHVSKVKVSGQQVFPDEPNSRAFAPSVEEVSPMRQVSFLCIAAVAAAASTGCATLVHGPRQTVTVRSEPSGAQVTVLSDRPGGARIVRSNPGVTPIRLRLTRRDPYIVIRIEKDGCSPAEVRLKRTISGWIASNLLFANPMAAQGLDSASDYPRMAAQGLAVSFGIDFISGAAFKLPKTVQVTLEPSGSCPGALHR